MGQPGGGRQGEVGERPSRGMASGSVPRGREQTNPMHVHGWVHGSEEGKPCRRSTMEAAGTSLLEMQKMRRRETGDEGRGRREGEGNAAQPLAE